MAAQNHVNENAIKRPQDDKPLTKRQEKLWMEYANDPFKFFTEVCYVRGNKGKVLFDPRIYQEDLLNTVIDNTHSVIVSPRQSGKCSSATTWVTVRANGKEYKMKLGDLHEAVAGGKELTPSTDS